MQQFLELISKYFNVVTYIIGDLMLFNSCSMKQGETCSIYRDIKGYMDDLKPIEISRRKLNQSTKTLHNLNTSHISLCPVRLCGQKTVHCHKWRSWGL